MYLGYIKYVIVLFSDGSEWKGVPVINNNRN